MTGPLHCYTIWSLARASIEFHILIRSADSGGKIKRGDQASNVSFTPAA